MFFVDNGCPCKYILMCYFKCLNSDKINFISGCIIRRVGANTMNSENNCLDLKSQAVTVFINCVNLQNGRFLSQHLMSKFENSENTNKKSIKIVGTLDSSNNGPSPPNAEIICFQNLSELFDKIKRCDAVVYDITESQRQVEEAESVVKCLCSCQDGVKCKLFILVSTVGTWATTEFIDEDEPEMPLTEEDFRSRKPHPHFHQQLQLEKMVMRLGKNNKELLSCVVVSGLTYGGGENIFNFLFKAAWQNDCPLPLYGCGKNLLPTIHVSDLAKIIATIIEEKPNSRYILATDNSQLTYQEITEAIGKHLSTGKVLERPRVDAFLNEDLTQMQIDLLSIDLHMVNSLLETHGIELDFGGGLIENLDSVTQSYRDHRNLPLLKIIICGPPCSGKTTISEQLSRMLKVPTFNLNDMRSDPISEIRKKLAFCPEPKESTGDEKQAEEVDKEKVELLKLLDEIRALTSQGMEIGNELLMRIMRQVLSSKLCNVHGFILDGFPETMEQAQQLFQESTENDQAPDHIVEAVEVQNNFIFNLNPSDSYYYDFVLNLSERTFQDSRLSPESLNKRLVEYKSSTDHKLVLEHLQKCSFQSVDIEISCMNSEALCNVIQRLPPFDFGKRVNHKGCGPQISCGATVDVDVLDNEDKFKEALETCNRMKSKTFHKMEEEKYCLNIASSTYYKYLSEKFLQRCAKGINKCYSEDPCDPVEFLAKYIFEGCD